jgi:hypothetical protein
MAGAIKKLARGMLSSSAPTARAAKKRRGRRLPAGRAVLLGAGLATAGRWLVGGRAERLTESARDWLEEQAEWLEGEEQPDQEPEGDEDEIEEDEELEPEPELDEEDEEPEPEEEDEEPVPVSRGRARAPRRGR